MRDNEKQREAQLHEVLAVDRELDQKDKDERAAAIDLLSNRAELFQGHIKTLKMLDDDDRIEEAANTETKQLYLTVDQVLGQALDHTVRYMDALYQKERTNQDARADVVLEDGTVLLENVPATALLALERIVMDMTKLYAAAPVLPAGIKWVPDKAMGDGISKADPDIKRLRTKNVKAPIELSPATDRHPAQAQLIDDTINVGEYTEQRWSAMMVPARKMELLARLDELQRAVKKARMRANETRIVSAQVGRKIVDWLNRD